MPDATRLALDRHGAPQPSGASSATPATRILVVLVVAALGLHYLVQAVVRPIGRQTDLAIHLDLAELARRGVNVYRLTPAEAESYRQEFQAEIVPLEVNYPPSYFAFLSLFTTIERATAGLLWLALQHVCLVAAIALLMRTAGLRLQPIVLALIALLAGFFEPLFQTFRYGQITPWLLLLVSAAMADLVAKNDRRAGLWLGLAAALKVTPAVLLFIPLSRRRSGVLIGLLAACAMVALAMAIAFADPITLTRDFLLGQSGRGFSGSGRASVLNQSLAAFLARLEWVAPGNRAMSLLSAAATPLSVAALVVALVLALPRFSGVREAFGILVLAVLITTPVSWEHGFSLLLLPAVIAIGAAHERRLGRPAALLLVLGWSVVAADLPYDHPALSHGLPALFASAKLFGALCFALGFALLARGTGSATIAPARRVLLSGADEAPPVRGDGESTTNP